MKVKAVFIFLVICMIITILFSFFIVWNSFKLLAEVEKMTYSVESEAQKLYEIKDFSLNEAVCDITEEKSGGVEQEKNIVAETDEALVILENKKESLGEFKLTAYCSCEKCCGEWALNRPKDENGKDIVYGSTGTILVAGTSIATDPSVIPYGSQVEINGHIYTAHDTGGAIQGNRIDVYFDSHQDALNFGVQYADVYLVK